MCWMWSVETACMSYPTNMYKHSENDCLCIISTLMNEVLVCERKETEGERERERERERRREGEKERKRVLSSGGFLEC